MNRATAQLLAIDRSARFLGDDGKGRGPRQRILRIGLSVLASDTGEP